MRIACHYFNLSSAIVRTTSFWCTTLILVLISVFPSPLVAQQKISFNRDIRPILSENCFFCHGQDAQKREADLRLDIESAAIDAGAIDPGDPEGSGLIDRVFSEDESLQMPPKDSNRHLTQEQKQILLEWIKQGGKYQTHWAFQKLARPVPPKVKNESWIRNPIDRFVLAKLEDIGLSHSPEADRPTLIKRLSIDLVGIPPTPNEVQQFVQDKDPKAYENLVDRLLASPHYGERQALPWLDAARYSDSNGFQQDGDTWQWMWRDWLVKALNEDMPFDEMTKWMLAGDLLPAATTEQKIASGFNRNHMLNGEGGAIAEEQRFVNLFDRVDTTSKTWLGLTMSCAQCHDHKYDPITQEDYYRFLDAFNRVPESGRPETLSPRIRVAKPYLTLPTQKNIKTIAEFEKQISELEKKYQPQMDKKFSQWKTAFLNKTDVEKEKDVPKPLLTILKTDPSTRNEKQKKRLGIELKKHFDKKFRPSLQKQIPEWKTLNRLRTKLRYYKGDQIPRPMIMSDAKPRKTHILSRGEYLDKGKQVSFSTPAFLNPISPKSPKNRLGLVQWIIAKQNTLTSRVQVNRMWQSFFGCGIVKTVEDMGTQSQYPVHKDLLDWLAVEFQESGWKVKRMHRLIVTSATYRQSSRISKESLAKDPENRLYGRASRFRMPSMILRDWALSSAGILNEKIGGPPVYPYLPKNVWETLAITKERDFSYPLSTLKDLHRRSLYTFWRRTVKPANMFDSSNRQSCRVRQSTTSTPLHALTTLNDPTWVEASRVLAEKCITNHTEIDLQIQMAFQKVLCRVPSQVEQKILKEAYQAQLEHFSNPENANALLNVGSLPIAKGIDRSKLAALSAVCLAILNLDEALTRM